MCYFVKETEWGQSLAVVLLVILPPQSISFSSDKVSLSSVFVMQCSVMELEWGPHLKFTGAWDMLTFNYVHKWLKKPPRVYF